MRSRAIAFFFAGCVAVAIACAKNLEELAPFPCATDGSCPAEFTCLAGGCTPGRPVDGACATGTRCVTGTSCVAGICVPRCGTGDAICGPGRICTYPPPGESAEVAACVRDCATAACPPGLECQSLYGGKRGCVTRAASASLDRPCEAPADCQTRYGVTFLPITCTAGACSTFCAPPAIGCDDPARSCRVEAEAIRSGCVRLDAGAP